MDHISAMKFASVVDPQNEIEPIPPNLFDISCYAISITSNQYYAPEDISMMLTRNRGIFHLCLRYVMKLQLQ